MADAFATDVYYVENFGPPPSRIADRLQAELDRASRYVRSECPGIDARIAQYALDPTAPGALDPNLAADVVCEMVATAGSSPGGLGIQSIQQGAGPYQETQTFSNPVGDLYLSKKQKRLLGCGGQTAFTVSMAPDQPAASILSVGWCADDLG